MAHRNFGIKPVHCGQEMYLDGDDEQEIEWFACGQCDHLTGVPVGYFDNTPEEYRSKIK